MFDWQRYPDTATPLLPALERKTANSVSRVIQNIAITSLVCTLRNSKCAIQMIIQITHFALV